MTMSWPFVPAGGGYVLTDDGFDSIYAPFVEDDYGNTIAGIHVGFTSEPGRQDDQGRSGWFRVFDDDAWPLIDKVVIAKSPWGAEDCWLSVLHTALTTQKLGKYTIMPDVIIEVSRYTDGPHQGAARRELVLDGIKQQDSYTNIPDYIPNDTADRLGTSVRECMEYYLGAS